MQIIVAIENTKFYNAIKYTFQLLLSPFQVNLKYIETKNISQIKDIPLLISYGKNKPNVDSKYFIHIAEAELFGDDIFSHKSIPSPPFSNLEKIPVLYDSKNKAFKIKDNHIECDLDLIASSFFLASRLEEIIKKERDENDRFSAQQSLALQQNFLHIPLVDEYSNILIKWMNSFGLELQRKQINSKTNFTICLSHDIDTVSKGWMEALYYEIRHFSKKSQLGHLFADFIKNLFAKGNDLYWNFDQIMDLEHQYGAFSTFFFLTKTGDKRDASYNYFSRKMRTVLNKMNKNGYETGLHGSYDSLSREKLLAQEKKDLETASQNKIIGVRQHFLRFNVKNGWRLQEEAGLEYDTSLGFPDAPGFRAGLARPFLPFNLAEMRPYKIVEIPIIIMDGSFDKYLQLPLDQVWEYIKVVLEQVKRHNGAASIIWHNTYFTGYKFKGYKEIYEHILQWVQNNNGELVTCKSEFEKWKAS